MKKIKVKNRSSLCVWVHTLIEGYECNYQEYKYVSFSVVVTVFMTINGILLW